jgi:hypothetical protein
MRSNGEPGFPDPTVNSNGQAGFNLQGNGNSDLDPTSPQFQAASQACEKYQPGAAATPAEQAAATAKALTYAECMRSNDEPEFPDPNSQGVIQITSANGIDPTSSQFEAAQTACQSLDNGFSQQINVGTRTSS